MSAEEVEKWSGRAKPGMPLFPGPSDVREAFIRSKGIDWTASYIDPAIWVNSNRMIVTQTRIAFERINQQASLICKSLGITVRDGSKDARQRMAAE